MNEDSPERDEMSEDEVENPSGERLPAREAMSLLDANIAIPVNGAIAANVHGRGLTRRPFIADLERFVLVDASGEARPSTRDRCQGADRGRFSPDGRRVYLRSEHDCNGVKLVTTSVVSMVSPPVSSSRSRSARLSPRAGSSLRYSRT